MRSPRLLVEYGCVIALRIANGFAFLLVFSLASHRFTTDEFAWFSQAISGAILASVLFSCGLQQIALRLAVEEREFAGEGVIGRGLAILGLAFPIGCLFSVIYDELIFLQASDLATLMIFIAAGASGGCRLAACGYMRGRGAGVLATLLDGPTSVGFMLIPLLLNDASPLVLLIWYAAGNLIPLGLLGLNGTLRGAVGQWSFELIRRGAVLVGSNFIGLMFAQAPVLFFSLLGNADDIAAASVSVQIANAASVVFVGLNLNVGPYLARVWARPGAGLGAAVKRLSLLYISLSFIIFLLSLAVLGSRLAQIFFAHAFVRIDLAVPILLARLLVSGSGPLNVALVSGGFEQAYFKTSAATAGALALSTLLIHDDGAEVLWVWVYCGIGVFQACLLWCTLRSAMRFRSMRAGNHKCR